MLSLIELQRAARILDATLRGARLERAIQPDDFRLVLVFHTSSGQVPLLLSCHPEFARLCTVDEIPQAPQSPPSFAQYIRAHLTRGTFVQASASPENRQAGLRLSARQGTFELVLSLLGTRSNIYLLDVSRRLVHSTRPLEGTRSKLRLGDPWQDPEGRIRSEGVDRWAEAPDERYLGEVDKTYQILERIREAEILARRVETVLAREGAFLERKRLNLRQDLAEARKAEDYRRKGELLKSVLHAIRTGDDVAEVTDYDTGERVEIPLRPDLSPEQNLESYFARYHKESRGIAAIALQLSQVESARSEIAALRKEVELRTGQRTPDLQELRNLAAQPRVRKLLSRFYPSRVPRTSPIKAHGKKEVASRLLPKRYRTEQGLEIWVGRSDEGNDYLTTRLARGNDLFLHLEGYPGSHVVLRTEGRTDPPQGAILDACELAIHFSKLKEASRADVHVTQIKNVRKPKGAKPGLVNVVRGRTIHLRRSPSRLQNILASRLDE